MRRRLVPILSVGVGLTVVAAGGCRAPDRPVVAGATITAPAAASPRSPSAQPVTGRCGPHRAAVAGELPPRGPTTVAGVALPSGRVVGPAVWLTDAAVPDTAAAWAALVDRFPATGLWPVVVTEAGAFGASDERPAVPAVPDADRAAEVLAAAWARTLPDADDVTTEVRELLWPFRGDWPGPAPTVERCAIPLVDSVTFGGDARLALVAVTRPADVPLRTGWAGPPEAGLSPADLAAVLAGWEDRFGAYPVAVGATMLTVGVERPPSIADDHYRVAAELFALDPAQVLEGAESIGALASALTTRTSWTLWWA